MKIGCTICHFTLLPATLRPAAARGKGDFLRAADISSSSAGLPEGSFKHLRAIEQISAEIMNMTGGTANVNVNRPTGQMPAASPPETVITGNDVLIFLPPSACPKDGEERPGELIVVKGAVYDPAVGDHERQEGKVVVLARDVAAKLSHDVLPLGTDSANHDLSEVREKFIVSVDAVDGIHVPSIIRHDSSGGRTIPNEGAGRSGDTIVPAEVAKIAAYIASLYEDVPMDDPPGDALLFTAVTQDEAAADEAACSTTEMAHPGGPSLLANPVAVAKETGLMVSRLVCDNEGFGEEGQGKSVHDLVMNISQSPAGSSAPGVGRSRVVVTFVESVASTGVAEVTRVKADSIAKKMVALSEAIDGFVAESAVHPEGTAGDEAAAATAARCLPVKEAMKQRVAASFAGALQSVFDTDALDTAKTFGMDLDEKGLLMVDREVLRDSLSGRKDGLLRFVHDLAVSLHDRIGHNAYAFAGAYARVAEAVLDAPRGKDSVSGDDADRKVDFERRLNELQMLLKISHELKDSFMQRSLAGSRSG